MEISPDLIIPDMELRFTFLHASGPGGQNANKIESAVQLRFNVVASPSLSSSVKERLLKLAGSRVTQIGELIIEAKRYRSQDKNRDEAKQRLVKLIQKALFQPKERHATRPSFSSRLQRLDAKKRHGMIKRSRQIPSSNDDK
jgi:ribosome-associated protein